MSGMSEIKLAKFKGISGPNFSRHDFQFKCCFDFFKYDPKKNHKINRELSETFQEYILNIFLQCKD